jgi:Flp pilus assembly protein TadD
MIVASAEQSALYIAGLHHIRANRIQEAVATLRRVVAHDPSHQGARRNLIRALNIATDHEAVIAETAIDPSHSAEIHFLRGTAFSALSRPEEARDSLTIATTLDPGFAPAWVNLGNAFADLDQLPAAEIHCRRALALDPSLIEAHVSLGFILTAQGRLAEGIERLECAIRQSPGNVHAHWNLATAALLSGDLPRGFAEYEWRKRHDRYRRDFINLPGPVWTGDDPSGRTILVHAEQGLGDTIQFARYLPLIAERGGTPILACEPSLIPLLATIGDIRVVSKFAPLPPHDAWIDQMSLPNVFGTTLDTIPSAGGYLTAPRLLLPRARRIGLAWAGNKLHRNDHRRTPPAEVFAPLLAVPGCHFISLMPGLCLPGTARPPRNLTDYAETAALIAALDLVITVDTSVAHVAGALGCPAWVLLPYAPDWRWLLNRSDTPWYDSLRLFRQGSPGDWRSVIASVAAALAG